MPPVIERECLVIAGSSVSVLSRMRFGIKTAPQETIWAAMLDVWREADDIDVFESAWNFDHFYPIFSDSTGPCLEAWMMLAAMAQATKRIRIGTKSAV